MSFRMGNLDIFIGIEGVGSRLSVGVLSDASGTIRSSHRLLNEPLTLHTTPSRILRHRLIKLLSALLGKADLKIGQLNQACVCVGLTGVTFRYDQRITLPKQFSELGLEVGQLICTGDAEIVFASHTQSTCGSAVICHSGSTAYVAVPVNDRVEHYRVGGWGPVFGDEGSGYWLGCQVLRAIGEEHDLHRPASVLWSEVESWLQEPCPKSPSWRVGSSHWKSAARDLWAKDVARSTDPRTLLFYFAHAMQQQGFAQAHSLNGIELWRQIASGLVIPLFRAFERGDSTAVTIVERGVEHLAKQHYAACRLAKEETGQTCVSPVVLYGGVFYFNRCFRELLMERLKVMHEDPSLRFTNVGHNRAMRPVCGALLFSLGRSNTGDLRLPRKDIVERVNTTQAYWPFEEDLMND